jgi:cytochrome c-type biogenesis protein CcmH/NrfG
VASLHEFLKVCPSDKDGWAELANLYLALNEYRGAKAALEELIILEPENHNVFIRYADILCLFDINKYAQTAREYYCLALETDEQNLRALKGLYQV